MRARSTRLNSQVLFIIAMTLILIAGSASAQPLAGISVTTDNVDNDTLTVDITATVFYSTGFPFGTAWLGDAIGGGATQYANAVEWGDGSFVAPYYPAGIAFDTTSTPPGAPGAVRAFRMAFSHAYADIDTYTITVNSHASYLVTGYPFTGNTVTSVGGRQIITANTTLMVGAPPTPTIDITTVSDMGLLLLALAIGMAGLFLLRR